MNDIRKGLLAVHSAVFLFGLTALFSKLIDLSAMEITLLRSVFAVLTLWLVMHYQGLSLKLRSCRDYYIALLLGVLLAVHWVTYFHAMQVASVAVGVIALFTFPVITVFLEPFFHAGRPRPTDIVSALAVLFGIYLLVPSFSLDNQTTQGVLWGVFSALLFSLRNIIQGRYFARYPAKQSLLYQIAITFLLLLPFEAQTIPQVSHVQWAQLVLLGVVFTALPHTLFAFSLRYFKAKTTSLIACLQVVYATLFAVLVLGEWPSLMTVAGGLIVVAGAMFETYSMGRRVTPTLKAIFVATSAGEPMQSVASSQALVDAGLQGDRYSKASGFWKATDACQVSLISEDDLNRAKRANAAFRDKLDQGAHRRNLVVGGIKTTRLQGMTFRIGQAIFRYQKPRPPCAYLEKIEGQGISRALGKHSGVCLDVIPGGTISIGDTLEIIDPQVSRKP